MAWLFGLHSVSVSLVVIEEAMNDGEERRSCLVGLSINVKMSGARLNGEKIRFLLATVTVEGEGVHDQHCADGMQEE